MVYSPLVLKASLIAYNVHKEDFDKSGYPYVMHPFYLAFGMEDEITTCVALLHDVIEDHGDRFSLEMFEKEGFPREVIDALRLLAHSPDVPYMDYVRALADDPVAKKVKIADLMHNSDRSRMGGKPFYKESLYREALEYLTKN